MKTEEIIKFLSPPDLLEVFETVGTERELKACIAIGLDAVLNNSSHNVLLTGPPGGGKTTFSKSVGKKLVEVGVRCSAVVVPTNAFLRVGIDKMVTELPKIERLAKRYDASIIVWDELDTVSTNRFTKNPSFIAVTGAMMHQFGWGLPRTVNMALANYPENLDIAIQSRIEAVFYIGLPNETDIAKILGYYKIPNPESVSALLFELAEDCGGRITKRSVGYACNVVSERYDDPEEMAKALFANMPLLDEDSVREYERLHAGYKRRSEITTDYWASKLPKLQEELEGRKA